MPDPRTEYSTRLAARAKIVDAKDRAHRTIGNLKLFAVVTGLAAGWLSLHSKLFSAYWILLPVAIYAALSVTHEFILRARTHAETAVAFYRRGLARIDDTWPGSGSTGARFRDPHHVYADDLDIFGSGCLFELLSTARLPMGEEFLAKWLSAPSPLPEILERQKVVADLRDKLDLREQLALLGEDLKVRLDPASLTNWAEQPAILPAGPLRAIAALLAIAFVAAFFFYLATTKSTPVLAVLLLEAVIVRWLWTRAGNVVAGIGANAEGLQLFARILARIESEPFTSPRLQQFAARLKSGAAPASQAIHKLARIQVWVDAREGLMAHLLELPVLYTVQVGFAAEAWRRLHGKHLRAWIAITGEVEALISLAAYSYEHPADPFPVFVDSAQNAAPHASSTAPAADAAALAGATPAATNAASTATASPIFDGHALGHPLIPAAKCVRNSVRLDAAQRILLVSGSNMSGKSTYLRTAGINAVLAMAGAPIRGASLSLTPLQIGSSIRRVDSLQENRSSFYTEILQIRDVFELTEHAAPVLFLFDELLEGTNSHDRKIGAEGLLQALVERNAIGIVTTHDLAVTEISGALHNVVTNVHFQDYVEEGKMRFDHKLREGVVAKSNALELMRLIGLKV